MGLAMGKLINAFIRFVERRYSRHTVTLYRHVLQRFSNYAPQNPASLTMKHIESYINSLSGLTNRSINAHLACLKSFGNYLADYHDLPNPATKFRKLPEAPPKQRILSESEYHKLVQSCKGTIEGDVIQFLAHTGLRIAEFRSLTPGSFSGDGRFIRIVGKGNKPRTIPLNKTTQAIIAKHKPDMKLLKSFKTRNSVYNACMQASKLAGIPKASPHALRHYFATSLFKRGVPIGHISKLLGHSSVRTTEQIYIHFTSASLYGVTDVLDD